MYGNETSFGSTHVFPVTGREPQCFCRQLPDDLHTWEDEGKDENKEVAQEKPKDVTYHLCS